MHCTAILIEVSADANSKTTVEGVDEASTATVPADSSTALQTGVIELPREFFHVVAKFTVADDTELPVTTRMTLSSPYTAEQLDPHVGTFPPVMRWPA